MKYAPKYYAEAFAALAWKPMDQAKETELVKNFLALITRNGDMNQIGKILNETEAALRARTGRRKVTIETARSVDGLYKELVHFVKKDDIVEEKVDPKLVAGLRVVVNDTLQFDGTLKRKLDALFPD